jgi:hypothetical protein
MLSGAKPAIAGNGMAGSTPHVSLQKRKAAPPAPLLKILKARS